MAKNGTEIFVGCVLLLTLGLLFIFTKTFSLSLVLESTAEEYKWVVHGLINILGYSTVLVPGYLIYRHVKKENYLAKTGTNYFSYILQKCFGEEELIPTTYLLPTSAAQISPMQDVTKLMFYFCGLQVSFLSWGVLQEKVMTQKYTNVNDETGYFKDSQFLVFVNRILAFCLSGMVVLCTRHPRHVCPLYKYSFCSLSNILSSWCQYEALKYVSFPHQVLAKAAKTIPVMIMGKIISRTKYEYYEYVTALMLSIGMFLFMFDTGNDQSHSTVTTVSGIILLCSYIVFDSFTSNFQGDLFKQFAMSPVQMMCAVNLFSCLFTAVSLIQQGGFVESINFMFNFPRFIVDCLLLSVCSAAGQLFIYSTLASFGPLVFAIITTIRQGFSILLSCLIYHHYVGAVGVFGVTLVFLSILLRIYCSYRIKRRGAPVTNPSKL